MGGAAAPPILSSSAALPPAEIDAQRIDQALLRERLHLYETNVWPAVGAQSGVALLVGWAFRPAVPGATLALWAGAMLLALALRLAVNRWLRRERAAGRPETAARLWAARLAVAGTGAAWGLGGVLFFATGDQESRTLLAFVMAGVAAGSLSMMAFDLTAAFLFAALTLTPLGLDMVRTGGSANTTMGTMALMLVLLLGFSGARGQRQAREMVVAREAERQRAESLLENQRRLEQLSLELQSQREALALTLDSMDQGILRADADGRIHFHNRRLLELLDLPEVFLAGRPTLPQVAEYQRAHGHFGEDFAFAQPAARDYLRRWFQGERGNLPDTYLRRTHHGTMLEVRSRRLADGGLVRTFSDVTAFFETREQLLLSQAEEGKLALVAAHTDNAVAITDATDRIEWVNEAFVRMTGYGPAQAVGHTLAELLRGPDSDLDALRRMDQQLRQQHKSSGELRYQFPDGRTLWLALETHAVRAADGSVRNYISIGRDVSERHAADAALRAARDEAERASRAKSEFLSAMSHELRTPMNAILGFGRLLQTDASQPLAGRQRSHVQQIVGAGTHLLALIDDVLDLARVEAGKQPILLEPVALDGLVHDCVDLVRPLADEQHLSLQTETTAPAEGCWVNADRTRLKQVLLNLLSNAIKYNRPGGEVRLRFLQADSERGLEISDTGQGLGPEQQALLFEPFERLGAEGGTIPGAGIGLALTKRMLEMMQGRIEVDSEPGLGSRFRIWLRGADGAAPRPAAPAEASAPAVRHTVAQHVLYIEDNPVNVMLMEALMEREPGVRPKCAPLPEVGLALARAAPPDLLLLDVQLPGIDGFEVLRRLRADPVTQRVPVVAVSANAMPADIERARVAGFDDYLTKPIDFDRLRALLQRFGPPAAG